MQTSRNGFLRHTAAVVAAFSGLVAFTDANAQSAVRLTSGSTSAECPYSSMSVAPNGTVTVACSSAINSNGTGGGGGPAPTRFSLSSAGGTLTPGASPSPALQIMRSGDTNGQYTVGYSVAGASCASPGTYQLTFTSGGTGSQTITQAAANSTAGTCTVTLGNSTLPDGSSGNVNTGITAAVFQVSTSGGGGGNPPPTGCPAAPAGMAIETFGLQYAHNYWMTQANGMMAATMPATTKSVPTLSYVPSPRTNTPATGYVRFSISKCPGQISEDYTDRCNRHSFVSFTSLRWVNVPSGTLTSKEAANAAGLCWAPASEGPWYLNIRHEFAEGCNYGASMCGVLWAWQ